MISTSPSDTPSVIAPGGILRTASAASFAWMTTRPSSRTSTSVEVRTVISRSVPVTRNVEPTASHEQPLEDRQSRSSAHSPVGPGEHVGEVVTLGSDAHPDSFPASADVFLEP